MQAMKICGNWYVKKWRQIGDGKSHYSRSLLL